MSINELNTNSLSTVIQKCQIHFFRANVLGRLKCPAKFRFEILNMA